MHARRKSWLSAHLLYVMAASSWFSSFFSSLLKKLPGQFDLVEFLLLGSAQTWIDVPQESARQSVVDSTAQSQPEARAYVYRGLDYSTPCQLSVSVDAAQTCPMATIALTVSSCDS